MVFQLRQLGLNFVFPISYWTFADICDFVQWWLHRTTGEIQKHTSGQCKGCEILHIA